MYFWRTSMEKYEVIDSVTHCLENKLCKPYVEFKIKHNEKICVCDIECDYNLQYERIIKLDEELNKFDVAKALFEYDIDVYKAIEGYLIDKNMDDVWDRYNVGCGHKSIYKTNDEYKEAYIKEENRIKKYVKK